MSASLHQHLGTWTLRLSTEQWDLSDIKTGAHILTTTSFEDPELNILTQEMFLQRHFTECENIRALGTDAAICLSLGEFGTYLWSMDLISIWEAMNKNNKRALLEL
jgi:hypothetical protein